MQLCKYADTTGCKVCKAIFYKSCTKFRKAYFKDLLGDLVKFKYVPYNKGYADGDVLFSKDENKAKSAVADLALKIKCKVKRISANQAITLALGGDDIPYRLVFLDCKQSKLEQEKVQSVLYAFVDKLKLFNVRVVVSGQSSNIIAQSDWYKL